jgi:hypothetical protein
MRTLVALCLLAAAVAACAPRRAIPVPDPAFDPPGPDWVQGAITRDEVYFIATAQTERVGSIARVWLIENRTRLAPPTLFGSRSARFRVEYHCDRARVRSMLMSYFSGLGATGALLAERGYAFNGIDVIAPGTASEQNLGIVCALTRQ